MMSKERINELAQKFNANSIVAGIRYDEPKYAFAAVLTIAELLEEYDKKERVRNLKSAQRDVEREVRNMCGWHRKI